MTSGLILHKPSVGVLATDGQFHGPWNAKVTWGLEDSAVGLWGAVAGVKEGEVSKGMLIGSKGVTG